MGCLRSAVTLARNAQKLEQKRKLARRRKKSRGVYNIGKTGRRVPDEMNQKVGLAPTADAPYEALLLHPRPHPDSSRGPRMDQFYGEECRDDFLLRRHRHSGLGSGGPGSAD